MPVPAALLSGLNEVAERHACSELFVWVYFSGLRSAESAASDPSPLPLPWSSPQIHSPAADPLGQPRPGADTEQLGRRRLLGPAQPGFPLRTLLQKSGDAQGERRPSPPGFPACPCSFCPLWTLSSQAWAAACRGLRATFGFAACWPPSGCVA